MKCDLRYSGSRKCTRAKFRSLLPHFFILLIFASLPARSTPLITERQDSIPSGKASTGNTGNSHVHFTCSEGAIIRGDSTRRQIALIFTGDEYSDGFRSVKRTLGSARIKAGFFLTGRLYRNPGVRKTIVSLHRKGHYMGPHSDMHLLYNDWSRRDSLLVSKDSMLNDLMANYASMQALGIVHRINVFIPPFEWWNREIADWCREKQIILFNFSPGTATNADYTYPEMGASYRSSDTLFNRLLRLESEKGLNGCIILVHIGTDPRRTDKFYSRLPALISILRERGYEFGRVDEMIR